MKKTSGTALIRKILKAKKNWESICNRCGECCYYREVDEDGNVTVFHDRPCEFLDVDTKECSVYNDRFNVCDKCHKVTIPIALFADHLPPNCAYRKYFRD